MPDLGIVRTPSTSPFASSGSGYFWDLFNYARWVEGDGFDPEEFERQNYTKVLVDQDDLPIVLFRNDGALNDCVDQDPQLDFLPNPPGMPGLDELREHGWEF